MNNNFGIDDDVLELFSLEELGIHESIEDDNSWQKLLSKEDLKNEHFAETVKHYYVNSGKISERDVIDLKEAYKEYLPSQIKMAINSVFAKDTVPTERQTLGLALLILRKDRFGSRETVTFNNEPKVESTKDRRVIGFKECNVSGTDIKKAIEAQMGTDEIVDFDKIFRRNR